MVSWERCGSKQSAFFTVLTNAGKSLKSIVLSYICNQEQLNFRKWRFPNITNMETV
jgi:hypothetical protein